MTSKANLEKIRELWNATARIHRKGRKDQALRTFVKRLTDQELRWLNREQEETVIRELEIKRRYRELVEMAEERVLMSQLTPIEQGMLRMAKLRNERDALLLRLRKEGIGTALLARASGLTRHTIWQLTKKEGKGAANGQNRNRRHTKPVVGEGSIS